MENVSLDPFLSEKNLEHIRRLQGEGLGHSAGFGSPHSSTAARWALGVVNGSTSLGCASVE